MLDGLVEACLPGSLGRRLQRLEEAARVGVLEEGPVAVVGSAAVPGDLAIAVQSVSQLVYHQCLISCAWKTRRKGPSKPSATMLLKCHLIMFP